MTEKLEDADLEWGAYIIKQAQICRAEASALEQVVLNKLGNKYKLELHHGESIDFETGMIKRIRIPNNTNE